jgi:hypothetical protein
MVGRVRVVRFIAELMMPTVHCHPLEHGAFDRHRTKYSQYKLNSGNGLKRSMREESMIANCNPNGRQ